jgi:hypothetical protein
MVLLLNPLEEGVLVDEHPATDPADHAKEAVVFGVEDEMAKSTGGRPSVMLVPLRDGDKP